MCARHADVGRRGNGLTRIYIAATKLIIIIIIIIIIIRPITRNIVYT